MKTKLLLPLLAVILTGALAGCVDQIVPNPTYNADDQTVTVQFVLNIAAEQTAKTKQTANTVQYNKNFLGLNSATLFTFSQKNGTNYNDGQMLSYSATEGAMEAEGMFDLSKLLEAGAIDQSATAPTDGSVPKSRRVIELTLPTGTNTVLFYGKAKRTNSTDDDETHGKLGYLMPGDGRTKDLSQIGCYAASRIDTLSDDGRAKRADFLTIEKVILAILNHIDSIGVNGPDSWNRDSYSKTITFEDHSYVDIDIVGTSGGTLGSTIMWKDYAMCDTSGRLGKSPLPYVVDREHVQKDTISLPAAMLEQILGNSYNLFGTINTNELRAGSGGAVASQLLELYNIFDAGVKATATNGQEEVAQEMMRKLQTYISSFVDPTTGQWKSKTSIENALKTATGSYGILDITLPAESSHKIQNFPHDFNLPYGASTLIYEGEGTGIRNFAYNTERIALTDMGGTNTYMSVYDYTYPPELTYYGNGPVRISRQSGLTNNKFPDGTTDWMSDAAWNSSTNAGVWVNGDKTDSSKYGHVESDTRGVALAYNVQYGVGLLETNVRFGATVLNDNNRGIHPSEQPHTLKVTADSTLVLTGVLIGGQPGQVGWDYTYKALADQTKDKKFNGMIYDMAINNSTITTSFPDNGQANNYTFVFDNYNPNAAATETEQNVVYVALEFTNLLGNFWGNANMVRYGGTFYLIGKLDLNPGTNSANTTTAVNLNELAASHPFMPYKTVNRVFIQDLITKANFTIGENSLKAAYVTVPDLRSSKISLGLSVDLQWEAGNIFNVTLGSE